MAIIMLTSILIILINFTNVSFVISECKKGYFILPGQKTCQKWLHCSDISNIEVREPIGYGTVKNVYLAKWGNHYVAYNELRNEKYKNDFNYGLEMLKSLNPSPYIVKLIGFCEEKSIIITEYHNFNNANNIKYLLQLHNRNSIENRLNLCLQYANILKFLHNSPVGTRVNCDSNDLWKLLSQLLVSDSFDLILNDLDALPEVKPNRSIICGPRPIYSNFVAPEQKWQANLNLPVLSGYNEKTDIWKAADVCDYFIQGTDSEIVQYFVFNLHKKCKNLDPNERPSASFLVQKYTDILLYISSHSEL